HVFSHVRHCCHRQRRYAVAVAGCSPAFYRRRSAVGVCARFRSLIQFTIGIWTAVYIKLDENTPTGLCIYEYGVFNMFPIVIVDQSSPKSFGTYQLTYPLYKNNKQSYVGVRVLVQVGRI
ncbi:hypothetical protein J6590_105539, partial [Homalodisca vitripennis]